MVFSADYRVLIKFNYN